MPAINRGSVLDDLKLFESYAVQKHRSSYMFLYRNGEVTMRVGDIDRQAKAKISKLADAVVALTEPIIQGVIFITAYNKGATMGPAPGWHTDARGFVTASSLPTQVAINKTLPFGGIPHGTLSNLEIDNAFMNGAAELQPGIQAGDVLEMTADTYHRTPPAKAPYDGFVRTVVVLNPLP